MAKKAMRVVRATGERQLSEHMEDLAVPLTSDELLMRGQELARLKDEELKYEAEFESVKATFKKREKDLLERRSHLSDVIRDKQERRPVRVESWAMYDRGVLEDRRTDNGEIVYERALLASELQEELPLSGSAGAEL